MVGGDRYFMSSVAILQAIDDLKRAHESLNHGVPLSAVALMRCVVVSMVENIEKTMMVRLSDRSSDPKPGCENGCGYEVKHHICGRPECTKE